LENHILKDSVALKGYLIETTYQKNYFVLVFTSTVNFDQRQYYIKTKVKGCGELNIMDYNSNQYCILFFIIFLFCFFELFFSLFLKFVFVYFFNIDVIEN